jgi:hypothetical protein
MNQVQDEHQSTGSADRVNDARVSLVVPTTGGRGAVERLLGSVLNNSTPTLLRSIELIIYLNFRQDLAPTVEEIQAFVSGCRDRFHSVKFSISESFHGTAEESALAAASFATGEYLWISGDRRIYLPEGLERLETFLQGDGDCAYFNSVWIDREGVSDGEYSTFFHKPYIEMPYKSFIQSNGVNFIATCFGAWVVKRSVIDLDFWRKVSNECGPHFSHVFFYMDQLKDVTVSCYAAFMFIAEAKVYHSGDQSEWDRYAADSKSHRFFPWTLGLVRKYQLLIDRGSYSFRELRHAMCCERFILRRQVDEVFCNVVNQLNLGLHRENERMSDDEFEEIISFLRLAAPDKSIVCDLLQQTFEKVKISSSKHEIVSALRHIDVAAKAVNQDVKSTPLLTGLISQVGECYVRLHPRGYLYSKLSDTREFLWAYRVMGAPDVTADWIITETYDDAYTPVFSHTPRVAYSMAPASRVREGINASRSSRAVRMARRLAGTYLGYLVVRRLAPSTRDRLRRLILRL